jgi:hypothetical protein
MPIERSRFRFSTAARRAPAEDRLEIAARRGLLFHAKLVRLDRDEDDAAERSP